MSSRSPVGPPRPLFAGDIVVAHSAYVDAWSAAQIIRTDASTRTAAVLELDWSGPEPTSVADLGDVAPLVLTHHSWNGALSYCNHDWVLPRSHRVLGRSPLLHRAPSMSFNSSWRIGFQLALQRLWEIDSSAQFADRRALAWDAATLEEALREDAAPRTDIRDLRITGITDLDCDELVRRFPRLTHLTLVGALGRLTTAASLNRLASLQKLGIYDLFGMTQEDVVRPDGLAALESLDLHSIPAEYAATTRKLWKPEVPKGVYLDISQARKPDWVAENRDNPLRDWDGRKHISRAKFTKAVALFKETRRAVLAALAEGTREDQSRQLVELGERYGEAFNQLDRRVPFIETVEREELFAALGVIVRQAEATHGIDLAWAARSLDTGVERVRAW